MNLELIRFLILIIGWPILIIGAIFIIYQSNKFHKAIGGTVVGKLVIVLSLGILITMFSLGLSASFYMINDLNGVYLILPIFVIWFLIMSVILFKAFKLDKEAVVFQNYLKELDNAKNDFLVITSHQLRTPLTGIKWTLDLIKDDSSLKKETKLAIEKIYYSTNKLINLISNLLQVVKMDTGKIISNKENFNLLDIAQVVIENLKINATKNGQKIILKNVGSLDNKIPIAFGDNLMFSETLKNLLSNAINHGYKNKDICVNILDKNNFYKIEVINFGEKISDDKKSYIFNKFGRITNIKTELTADIGGLGLYISKVFTEQNGGEIFCDSNELTTTFSFTIPKKTNY